MKERIAELLKGIEKGSNVGDIGCDHGYLLIHGVEQEIINQGIGIDVVKGPYESAKQHVAAAKLQDRIQIRLGDGLAPLRKGEVDTLVIAGMGGGTILEILRKDAREGRIIEGVKRLILQPMSSEARVRAYLKEQGFTLQDENLLIDKKHYVFMIWERGTWTWDDEFLLEVGPILYEKRKKLGAHWNTYVNGRIKGYEHQLQGLEKGKDTQGKIAKTQMEKQKWEAILNDGF